MWTYAHDLKLQVQTLWDRGVLPRNLVNGAQDLPLRLVLKSPSASEILHEFEAVRAWITSLQSLGGLRLVFRDVRHRTHGLQRIPTEVWVDSLESALDLIQKRCEGEVLEALAEIARKTFPEILPWLEKRPFEAITLQDEWTKLLGLVKWIVEHPNPRIHFRQVDIPQIHSKFIENHRNVIAELASLALQRPIRAHHLADDLGFLEKPARIRLRNLDPSIRLISSTTELSDLTLDAASFQGLSLKVSKVFILENEINFLCFPRVDGAIAIFGAGYGWSALDGAICLRETEIHYWGDIDTHGFAILNQLRSHFPKVRSFLMDQETLLAHEWAWVLEQKPARGHLPHLTFVEEQLYTALQEGVYGDRVRLEQERIAYARVMEALRLLQSPHDSTRDSVPF